MFAKRVLGDVGPEEIDEHDQRPAQLIGMLHQAVAEVVDLVAHYGVIAARVGDSDRQLGITRINAVDRVRVVEHCAMDILCIVGEVYVVGCLGQQVLAGLSKNAAGRSSREPVDLDPVVDFAEPARDGEIARDMAETGRSADD